jgi:predicted  nucleic acid-binding Zn-ribbon protein
MAETATTRRNGFDRFNEALRNLDEEIQEFRHRVDRNRKRLEREVRKRADKVRTELRKSDVFKRADKLRKDVEDQIDRGRSQVYGVFGIASKSDVDRLNRKLNQLSRKLSDITKESAV